MALTRRDLIRAGLGASLAYALPLRSLGARIPGEETQEQCDTCDTTPPPGEPPGENPPGEQPPSEPPQGGGALLDLLPFLYMNMVKAPGKNSTFKTPMHMEGIGRCLSINDWGCSSVGNTGGAWHNYVITGNTPWVGDQPIAEIIFTKAPAGGGLEHHLAFGDRISIWKENLDWNRSSPDARFRTFVDDLERTGAIWTRRGVQHGIFHHEGGHQFYYTCGDPETPTVDYPLDSVWALLGAYAIDTPEGFQRANDELRQYVPDGLPVVYPEWLQVAKALPNIPAGSHTYLVARPDGWSPAVSNPTRPSDYRMTEIYMYLLVAPTPDMAGIAAGGRGLGMVRWIARNNDLGIYMREVALLTPVVDGRLYYDSASACLDQPLSAAVLGVGSGPTARRERRAREAYSMGQLGGGVLPKRIEQVGDYPNLLEIMY